MVSMDITINKNIQKAAQWLDKHEDEVIEFLRGLIAIESVNPWFTNYTSEPKEREVQEFIAEFLEKMGFTTDVWEPDWRELKQYKGKPGYYEGRDFTNRPNLFAEYKGEGGGRALLLTGHIDVVSAASGWTRDAFGGDIEDGKLFGRGAVDMKGGVAAMLMAARAVIESGVKLKGDIRVGTVSDEEAGGMGSLAFIHKGYRADGAIMTEATDMLVSPLCRGILWGRLTIKGRSGHIEIKQGDWRDGGAVDSIELARMYLNAIEAKNKEWSGMDSKHHPYIPIPCRINIAQINAGEYPTTYASQCDIVFNIQYLPAERDENLLGGNVKKYFADFVNNIALTNEWLTINKPEIEWLIDADCAETPVDGDFVQSFIASAKEAGYELGIEGTHCHTDMGWFCNVGIPTINFGAGNPKIAHQADEFVPIKDLIDSAKIIAAMLINWCGEAKE